MPRYDRQIENYNSLLVVEGYNDLLFYAEILEHLGKHGLVFIKEIDGKVDLVRKLEALVTPSLLSSKTKVGFLFDADANAPATSISLEGLLSRLTGQKVVDTQWSAGPPNIGLMVVPGGGAKGEIETLVWRSWTADPANTPQMNCITSYTRCMASQNVRAHSPDKGLLATLLAMRHDDDPRLGPAARSNVFDLSRPELQPLRTFLASF